ncbi:MAG: branched-chain amino acid ABC transporter permease [Chloroflexota bacterium]|nr:branched-chain amino acid ABC transporter permease [Chloroflexota bacterium]MDE3101810.1 branched-chain amino acid ABC transporter permease [Chloroflexota bacterium]
MFDLNNLATLAVSALLTGGLYATMSYGLALVYGVMKIINLAHAATMMLAAFTVLTLFRAFHLDPIIGSVVILPLFLVAGMALYRVAVGRVAAVPIASLLLLFGVWLVAQNAAYLIWGSEDQSILTSYTYSTISLFGVRVAVTRIIPFVLSLVMLGALRWFLGSTDLGRAIRAVSQDKTAARLAGIHAEQTAMIAFGIGTMLSAFAGGLLTLIFSFTPDFGGTFQLKSFAIIVLGGLESFPGVLAGSLVLSSAESFSILIPGWRASLVNLLAFGLLVATLVVFPGGLASLAVHRARKTAE